MTKARVLGSNFNLNGVSSGAHHLSFGTGLNVRVDDDLEAFGQYDVTVPVDNVFEQSFSAGMKLKF